MQQISKSDMDYLIFYNYLRQTKGNYKDLTGDKRIVVTGKFGGKSKKQRYAHSPLYNKLIELRDKDKQEFDINKVKDNQRYMFSDSVL